MTCPSRSDYSNSASQLGKATVGTGQLTAITMQPACTVKGKLLEKNRKGSFMSDSIVTTSPFQLLQCLTVDVNLSLTKYTWLSSFTALQVAEVLNYTTVPLSLRRVPVCGFILSQRKCHSVHKWRDQSLLPVALRQIEGESSKETLWNSCELVI